MGIQLTVTEFARSLADTLNRVLYRRERYTLLRGGKPIAEVIPVPEGRRLGDLPAILEALPRLSEADAEAFERDVDQARAELAGVSLADPWAS
jgi:antitoxin (DNA-binding transcriptional repressor) of toxin-antitoxin stability system